MTYNKKYYENHKQKILEKRKEYTSRPEVKERVKEYQREYYQLKKLALQFKKKE